MLFERVSMFSKPLFQQEALHHHLTLLYHHRVAVMFEAELIEQISLLQQPSTCIQFLKCVKLDPYSSVEVQRFNPILRREIREQQYGMSCRKKRLKKIRDLTGMRRLLTCVHWHNVDAAPDVDIQILWKWGAAQDYRSVQSAFRGMSQGTYKWALIDRDT